jgi:hypothetical protein
MCVTADEFDFAVMWVTRSGNVFIVQRSWYSVAWKVSLPLREGLISNGVCGRAGRHSHTEI